MKRFMYFENSDGGVVEHVFANVTELDNLGLLGWLDRDCSKADTALREWVRTASLGDTYQHRLGTVVRVLPAKRSPVLPTVVYKYDQHGYRVVIREHQVPGDGSLQAGTRVYSFDIHDKGAGLTTKRRFDSQATAELSANSLVNAMSGCGVELLNRQDRRR